MYDDCPSKHGMLFDHNLTVLMSVDVGYIVSNIRHLVCTRHYVQCLVIFLHLIPLTWLGCSEELYSVHPKSQETLRNLVKVMLGRSRMRDSTQGTGPERPLAPGLRVLKVWESMLNAWRTTEELLWLQSLRNHLQGTLHGWLPCLPSLLLGSRPPTHLSCLVCHRPQTWKQHRWASLLERRFAGPPTQDSKGRRGGGLTTTNRRITTHGLRRSCWQGLWKGISLSILRNTFNGKYFVSFKGLGGSLIFLF